MDNGCLKELPGLLKHLRTIGTRKEELEVVVAHFLGVDHVGHTYGPHDQHMDKKLRQIDAALSTTLEVMDESDSCHLTFIFGDHGMTEDGNHGGGTDNEVNAALFAHFSPACHDENASNMDLMPGSKYIQDAFQSIHQIDLVPTISILLGLPIPYANLGGLVPSLLGMSSVRQTAAALALNAAQVWRYFTVYAETANKLPNLPELGDQLKQAVNVYKEALGTVTDDSDVVNTDDSNAFFKACGLLKLFLMEAAELGHRVWTRFDTFGMAIGGSIVFLTLLVWIASLYFETTGFFRLPHNQMMENGLSGVFVFFQSGMLSFSNSYIEAEQEIVMFMIAVIGVAIFIRMQGVTAGGNAWIMPYIPLLFPILSRCAECFVSGHGQDPSIRLHPAHSPSVFLPALVGLMGLRVYVYRKLATQARTGIFHAAIDCITLLILAGAWIEKRSTEQIKNGYTMTRCAIVILILSTPSTVFEALAPIFQAQPPTSHNVIKLEKVLSRTLVVVAKLLIAVMVVTGPATAATVLLVSFQGYMLYILAGATGFYEVCTFFNVIFGYSLAYIARIGNG